MSQEVFESEQSRTYTLVRPRAVRAGAPLVLVLHGLRDTYDSTRRYCGGSFDRFAARDGAVVAYPDGVDREWNSARKAVMLSRRVKTIDDVGFLRALAEQLVTTWDLSAQPYVVGFSLGGQMAIRLICDAPGLLAGAALISSTLPAPGNRACSSLPPIPVPVLTFHGTADALAPWSGGTVGLRLVPGQRRPFFGKGPHESVPETLEWFARRNGIDGAPVTDWLHTGSGWAGRIAYESPGVPPVTGYTVIGGGHEIPGPRWHRFRPDTEVGGGLIAADAIAEFFGLAHIGPGSLPSS
ncbi:poly(3-hydroxybutyrate) depolymerase [Nocardia tenerifensis]|uniref:Poly(3-hydroxybutyrate) depolymerase n=1 Tax=Nocardia tenerifensis TaxID=228006 RepID=A0A318KAP1_9NOCA|nr:poly(3-hydroxybutyrate) depolymerase [Nocardia tenerifensis]